MKGNHWRPGCTRNVQCSAGLQWGSHFVKNFTRTSNQWHHHRAGLVTAAAAPQQNCLCSWTGTELPCTPEEHGTKTLHICYSLAGKQEAVEEHCKNNAEMLFWRLERTRLCLTSPPVWSSVLKGASEFQAVTKSLETHGPYSRVTLTDKQKLHNVAVRF